MVIEVLKAAPRFARGGGVNKRKQNSGNNLHAQKNCSRAAKDIPPACVT